MCRPGAGVGPSSTREGRKPASVLPPPVGATRRVAGSAARARSASWCGCGVQPRRANQAAKRGGRRGRVAHRVDVARWLRASRGAGDPVGDDRRGDHGEDRDRVAEGPVELGHQAEVHAVDRCDERRRQEDHGRHGEDLDDGVLLDRDHAQGGVEEEGDLLGQEAGMLGEEAGVAGERLQPDALVLAGLAGGGEVGDEPLERDEAGEDVGDHVALAAHALQHAAVVLRPVLAFAAAAEDLPRQPGRRRAPPPPGCRRAVRRWRREARSARCGRRCSRGRGARPARGSS